MRKIAVVTGTRADYGLLCWIIKGVHDDPDLALQLIVTGMHLSPEFGLTLEAIEKDGFPIVDKVEMLLSSDTETAIATSMGLGTIGFAKAYERLKPDILVVLGDRFEIFSAVSASVPFRIPVAHIHGGESTEGAIDEQFRHSITKMSHIHFPSTKKYAERIGQMGENPEDIFCYGAPGLDNIHKLKLLNREQLARDLDLPTKKQWALVTYHPETLEKDKAKIHIKAILESIKELADIFWIFTSPNADTEGRVIKKAIENHVRHNSKNSKLFNSLGQLRYLSLLKNSIVMVGNSSSGIIEAPSFSLPVINIGNRQQGRIKAENVIDIFDCEKAEIITVIKKAISKEFKDSINKIENPYGDGNTSDKIIEVLKTYSLPDILKKKFHDLQNIE
jgi:UDP-hydrolysing UDP-N-acetyl-D-glucosamine 2-epimerase